MCVCVVWKRNSSLALQVQQHTRKIPRKSLIQRTSAHTPQKPNQALHCKVNTKLRFLKLFTLLFECKFSTRFVFSRARRRDPCRRERETQIHVGCVFSAYNSTVSVCVCVCVQLAKFYSAKNSGNLQRKQRNQAQSNWMNGDESREAYYTKKTTTTTTTKKKENTTSTF